MIYWDGGQFFGKMEYGERLYGKMLYPNGDKYTGPFINDKRHTEPTENAELKHADGSTFNGPWHQDEKCEFLKFSEH